MAEGAHLIYQGCLISGDRVGRPDLLIRHDDGTSSFGAWYYEPVDIKAGKGRKEQDGKKTKFKKHYAFQILFYHDLLQDIQGTLPRACRIVNVEGEYEEFDRADFQGAFVARRAGLLAGSYLI